MTHALFVFGTGPLPDHADLLADLGLEATQPTTLGPGARRYALRLERSPAPLRQPLRERFAARGLDAFLREASALRPPGLLVFDMDSTLIRVEVIDELARLHGVANEVTSITRRAMNGELDFEGSLRARVALLEGLALPKALALSDALPVQAGAERLLAALRPHGTRTAVFSGGFTFAAERLAARLGLDEVRANVLQAEGGALTGRVEGEVVTPERKAQYLEALRDSLGVRESDVVAVGDGANDALMLAAAGFGVAFHAKPYLAERADACLSEGGLDRLLPLFGLEM
ncbi:MAG: phosphoserine phosphatase SerB [Myxococcota bacterium]